MKRASHLDDPRQSLLFSDDWADNGEASVASGSTSSVTAPTIAPVPVTSPAPAKTPEVIKASGAANNVNGPRVYAHPSADRRTHLGGHVVAYRFTRARRRSIGMVIGAEGLSVRAPRWTPLHEVEAALQERAAWILKHLDEQQAKAERDRLTRIEWRDGATIRFLGEPLVVVLDERVTGAMLDAAAEALNPQAALADMPRRLLRVGLRSDATPEAIRDTVHAWLQRQARRVFQERCTHFAQQLGVQMTRLSLSSARTRWGSAGADGSVRLNWRLIHYDMGCIDYVVAHELAHLRHMNHGPAFWHTVASVMPSFEQARAALREESLAAHD